VVEVGIYSKYKEGVPDGRGLMFDSRLVLAGNSANWKLPDEIDFEQLANFPLVLPALTNGLRMAVDAAAKRLKIPLAIIAEADSILAQKEMTLNCGCYMIKAPHTITGEKQDGIFASAIIRNPYINRYVVLVTGQQKPLSRAAREVATRATSILRGFSIDE
jgi:hypothetical protein